MKNPRHLEQTLTQLISQIASVRDIEGNSIIIGASIGATMTSKPEIVTISKMLNMADKLMYKAKKWVRVSLLLTK